MTTLMPLTAQVGNTVTHGAGTDDAYFADAHSDFLESEVCLGP